MSNLFNNNNDFVARFRARFEQARENRRRRQTRDIPRLQQLRQDLSHLAFTGHENLTRSLDAGQVLTRLLGCLEDRDHGDRALDDIRVMVLTALLEHGRQTFAEYYGPEHLAFGRGPVRAQLDRIRATLELALVHNDLGSVALALAMLDHVDGNPECQEAESSAPAQAAV
jgi:hypothetical protein